MINNVHVCRQFEYMKKISTQCFYANLLLSGDLTKYIYTHTLVIWVVTRLDYKKILS